MSIKSETQGFDLSKFTACIIGCGGLGTNTAVHLAGSGIGKLFLCDYDTVNPANLNRQFLYTEDDIGRKKAEVLSKKLSLFSPDSAIIPVNMKIEKENDLLFAKDADIIISCVDNTQARLVCEAFSKSKNIPLVDGAIDGFYGFSYLYIKDKCPAPSETGLFNTQPAKYSVSPTAGIIGSTQAALTIKYLLSENDKLSGKLLIYDEYKFDTLELNNT